MVKSVLSFHRYITFSKRDYILNENQNQNIPSVAEIIKMANNFPKRREDESFDAYKKRIKTEKRIVAYYLRGRRIA